MIEITAEYLASQGLSANFPRRFWTKVNKTDSCWLWTGAANRYGHIHARPDRPMIRAHRASWILHFGPVPEGKQVCHNCPGGDNGLCVNPAHLWLGNQSQNSRDMMEKGRGKLQFPNGETHPLAKLSDEQVDEIRRLYDPRKKNSAGLARQFGVRQSAISRIVHGVRRFIRPRAR